MWFVPRFLELAWSLAVFLFLALILGGNNALIHHPSTLMDRSRQQCNSRYNIASYSSVVDHRSKSQSFSPDGSFAAAFAIAGSNEQNSEEGRSKAVSQLSLDKAEYLVVLWHSLSEIGLEMDHPHTFDSIISAGLFEHIQHCIDVDLIRNYEVYDTTSSLLMEPRAAVVVVDPDNEPIHMENVLTVTRDWVKAMIADFSICPYTIDADRAGKPIGGVRYSISDAASPEEAFRDFWAEVYGMLSSKEEDVSTVLLTYPRKVFKDEGYFEKVLTYSYVLIYTDTCILIHTHTYLCIPIDCCNTIMVVILSVVCYLSLFINTCFLFRKPNVSFVKVSIKHLRKRQQILMTIFNSCFSILNLSSKIRTSK